MGEGSVSVQERAEFQLPHTSPITLSERITQDYVADVCDAHAKATSS